MQPALTKAGHAKRERRPAAHLQPPKTPPPRCPARPDRL